MGWSEYEASCFSYGSRGKTIVMQMWIRYHTPMSDLCQIFGWLRTKYLATTSLNWIWKYELSKSFCASQDEHTSKQILKLFKECIRTEEVLWIYIGIGFVSLLEFQQLQRNIQLPTQHRNGYRLHNCCVNCNMLISLWKIMHILRFIPITKHANQAVQIQ